MLSGRATDNMLLLLAFSGMLLGKQLEQPRTLLLLSMGAGVVSFVLLSVRPASPEGLSYYGQEFALTEWWHLRNWTAYLSYLFWRGLGPWLALLFLFLLPQLRSAPRALLGWGGVVLLVLSLSTKKNHYYIAVLWPLIPLLMAYAIAQKSQLQRALCALYLGWCTMLYVAQSSPDNVLAPYLGTIPRIEGSSSWGGRFQTADGELELYSSRHQWADSFVERVAPHLSFSEDAFVANYSPLEEGELRLRLLALYPKLPMKTLLLGREEKAEGVIILPRDRNAFPNHEQLLSFSDRAGRQYLFLKKRAP